MAKVWPFIGRIMCGDVCSGEGLFAFERQSPLQEEVFEIPGRYQSIIVWRHLASAGSPVCEQMVRLASPGGGWGRWMFFDS